MEMHYTKYKEIIISKGNVKVMQLSLVIEMSRQCNCNPFLYLLIEKCLDHMVGNLKKQTNKKTDIVWSKSANR